MRRDGGKLWEEDGASNVLRLFRQEHHAVTRRAVRGARCVVRDVSAVSSKRQEADVKNGSVVHSFIHVIHS